MVLAAGATYLDAGAVVIEAHGVADADRALDAVAVPVGDGDLDLENVIADGHGIVMAGAIEIVLQRHPLRQVELTIGAKNDREGGRIAGIDSCAIDVIAADNGAVFLEQENLAAFGGEEAGRNAIGAEHQGQRGRSVLIRAIKGVKRDYGALTRGEADGLAAARPVLVAPGHMAVGAGIIHRGKRGLDGVRQIGIADVVIFGIVLKPRRFVVLHGLAGQLQVLEHRNVVDDLDDEVSAIERDGVAVIIGILQEIGEVDFQQAFLVVRRFSRMMFELRQQGEFPRAIGVDGQVEHVNAIGLADQGLAAIAVVDDAQLDGLATGGEVRHRADNARLEGEYAAFIGAGRDQRRQGIRARTRDDIGGAVRIVRRILVEVRAGIGVFIAMRHGLGAMLFFDHAPDDVPGVDARDVILDDDLHLAAQRDAIAVAVNGKNDLAEIDEFVAALGCTLENGILGIGTVIDVIELVIEAEGKAAIRVQFERHHGPIDGRLETGERTFDIADNGVADLGEDHGAALGGQAHGIEAGDGVGGKHEAAAAIGTEGHGGGERARNHRSETAAQNGQLADAVGILVEWVGSLRAQVENVVLGNGQNDIGFRGDRGVVVDADGQRAAGAVLVAIGDGEGEDEVVGFLDIAGGRAAAMDRGVLDIIVGTVGVHRENGNRPGEARGNAGQDDIGTIQRLGPDHLDGRTRHAVRVDRNDRHFRAVQGQ